MKVIGSLGVLACLSALCLGMPACNGYATVEYTNPIYENDFPDPAVLRASDGMFYVYATNDQQQFEATDGLEANDCSHIKSIVMMSSADLANWTYHGTIDMPSLCGTWATASWMPSIVSRMESSIWW